MDNNTHDVNQEGMQAQASANSSKFLTKRYFLQHKKELAKLLKVYKLHEDSKFPMTVWVYELKDDYKFHHMNIGVTIPNSVVKQAVKRNKLKRKIKNFFKPFLQKNKRLFIWVRVG